MFEGSLALPALAAALALLAFGAGLWLGRRTGPVRRLTAERDAARAEHEHYRAQVAEHFGETSRRLHALTVEYRSVYDHLAASAEALCPESFEALGRLGAEGRDVLPEAAHAGAEPASPRTNAAASHAPTTAEEVLFAHTTTPAADEYARDAFATPAHSAHAGEDPARD